MRTAAAEDLDHIIPVSLYPTNEMWNLVPADPKFNSHHKGAKLPSAARIQEASPLIKE